MILTTILIISLWCNGVKVVTGPEMIFEFVELWLLQLLFPNPLEHNKIRSNIYKPLLGCIKCMASVHGFIWCLVLLPHTTALFWQIPLICVCASAVNVILYNAINPNNPL